MEKAERPTTEKKRQRTSKRSSRRKKTQAKSGSSRPTNVANPPPSIAAGDANAEQAPPTKQGSDDTAFGAGILDSVAEAQDVAAPPQRTAVLEPPETEDRQSARQPDRRSSKKHPRREPAASSGKSLRKSRKQRLEEEAQVIEAASPARRETTTADAAGGASTDSTDTDVGFDEQTPDRPAPKLDEEGSGRRRRGSSRGNDSKTGRKRSTRGRHRKSGSANVEEKPAAEAHVSGDGEERESATVLTETSPEAARGRRRGRSSTKIAPTRTEATEASAADSREMLINVAEPDECRIAILRGGRLDELYLERSTTLSHVGNIYKGRVTNVESSIQAAFIDFGLPSHGFLHISDLHPEYFTSGKGEPEVVGKKTPRRQRPPIQNCLKRGQEVIVQVIKEGIGTKGPTLSSYISLPGRFLVMMPGMEQLGVSRKIEDEDQRRKMREILGQLSLPKEMGFILRTAGVDRAKRDLQRDLNFLVRLWKKVDKRIKTESAPAELYRESDLVIRTIRDVYDSSLRRIVVDDEVVGNRVREFLSIASPRSRDVVEVFEGSEPLFHRYGIEAEIDRLHSKTVPLPCGGSLVIEQTEALVAIDVNSGRFRVPENAEETAYRVNLEAADEIARQLRLRDLGGLIICDLIDMSQDRHRRAVERRLSEALRKHKERAKTLRISRFGLIEMTRQRQGPSLVGSMFRECPKCRGSGHVKAPESSALDVMRQVQLASQREGVACIDVRVPTAVANEILNRKRQMLCDLERKRGQTIRIHGVDSFATDQVVLSCSDRRGREVGTLSVSTSSGQGGSKSPATRGRRRGGRGRGR